MNYPKAFILPLALAFSAAALGQQRYELTVKEAVNMAFANVLELKSAGLDYAIQEAKNKEILGQALPQLSGAISANHYLKLPQFLFPDATSTAVYQILKDEGVKGANGPITNVPAPALRQVSFQQPWNINLGATLNQLLFQPDVFVGLQARQTALDYARANEEQVRERIKDSAYKRYYAILIAQKQVEFVNESIERLQKLYNDNEIMYKNGFAERLDLDKVQVQLNNLKAAKNNIATAVDLSYAALKLALGLSQKDTVVLKETLNSVTIRNDILSDGFTYEDRSEVRTLNELKKLQELDLKRTKLGYIPTVAAVGNYTLTGMGPKFFTSDQTLWLNSSFIGLNVQIPLFDGNQRKYKVQQAVLNVEKLENTINTVKQGIDFQQVASKAGLASALNTLDTEEKNVQLAEKVFNATKLKFQEGLGSSFEVLQADSDLQQAQSNYYNALYNAIVAKISYQYSLGKL